MTQLHDSGEPGPTPRWSRFTKASGVTALAVLGGVLLGPQAISSPDSLALDGVGSSGAVPALAPPAGTTWIVGTLTDQAAHGQDNVNVEAWPSGSGAVAPAASALTYGGPNFNAVAAHGFFRLEVPSNQAYRIVFSTVGGKEDGDAFRMQKYGHGRPIAVRTGRAAPGRIRNLGTIALVRQGKVTSQTRAVARPAKVNAGERAKVRVTVSSRFVTSVTGRVLVKVAGHKLKGRLKVTDHGKLTMKLPKFHHRGRHTLVAHFVGTNTVHSSKAKPVKIKVVKKK
jgi:Bacterial Ig-like domain (group 3)